MSISIARCRKERLVLALAMALVVASSSCAADAKKEREADSGPPAGFPTEPVGEASKWTPAGEDQFPQQALPAIEDTVTRDDVLKAAAGDDSAASAERFALLSIQFFSDSRGEALRDSDLDGIVSPDSKVRAYLWVDQASQVALGSDRALVAGEQAWVRSEWLGEDAGNRMRTSMFAWTSAAGFDEPITSWVDFRIDVRRSGDRWEVVEFVNAAGPREHDLPERLREFYLDGGKGWRRTPAK